MLTALLLSGYIVLGDSLCINGWPEVITQEGTHYVQNFCQPGRKMTELDYPDDLEPSAEVQTVIIALGTNDAIWGTPVDLYQEALSEAVQAALSNDLLVACILPPLNAAFNTEPYRASMGAVCPEVWDVPIVSYLPDGIHPDTWGKIWMAVAIKELMDN